MIVINRHSGNSIYVRLVIKRLNYVLIHPPEVFKPFGFFLKQSSHVELLGLLVVRIQRSPLLRSQQGSSHLWSVVWVSFLGCNEEQ